jgi:hypothetical protein
MPFHPTCLEIFRRASISHFGIVDINGLMDWRNQESSFKFHGAFPRHPDVKNSEQQWWSHNPGSEYLAANPVFIPSLPPLLRSAIHEDSLFSTQSSAFALPELHAGNNATEAMLRDPFLTIPREIRDGIVERLESKDIANLRLASCAFRQLRISLWYILLRKEMPWLWEVWSEEKPYFWTTVTYEDLKKEEKAREDFERELLLYRRVLKEEMPEIFDAWIEAEPTYDDFAISCRARHAALTPIILPKNRTNWYQLYRDIMRNWKDLKGLQNRRRIWTDIER